MNIYLLFFTLYAAFIAPISVRFSLRLGKRAGYGARIQLIGLPMARWRKPDDMEGERPIRERDVAKSLGNADIAILKTALSPMLHKRIRGSIRVKRLYVHARFSFSDASHTALAYALSRELVRALSACVTPDCRLDSHLEADFSGTGTEALFRGIISARLGSLALTAILFAAKYLQKRARQRTAKEDEYAASH